MCGICPKSPRAIYGLAASGLATLLALSMPTGAGAATGGDEATATAASSDLFLQQVTITAQSEAPEEPVQTASEGTVTNEELQLLPAYGPVSCWRRSRVSS